jgi:hypothetical protein
MHVTGSALWVTSLALGVASCGMIIRTIRNPGPTHSEFHIPNSEFKTLCPLSVGIGRQVNEHPLKVGIGYIGLAPEFGGGSAGD